MKYIVIDVREPNEFTSGHVKDSINIPLAGLMRDVIGMMKDIPNNANIIVYCQSGSRSHMAKSILDRNGFCYVINGINKAQVEEEYKL